MQTIGGHRWGDRDVVARYSRLGVSDPGEAEALASVVGSTRGRVLDLGVGTGRTTALLSGSAASYTGLDIAPQMIEEARRRHPGVDLRVGDASDLSSYDDASFDLVVFSFNGIDSLDRAGRARALGEMARVLAPGGRIVLSSLNRDGVSYDEAPWTLRSRTPVALLLELVRLVIHPVRTWTGVRHFASTRHEVADGPDWSWRPMRAHEFRFTVLFASVPDTTAMLAAAGLAVLGCWSELGVALDPQVPDIAADWVHYVVGAAVQRG